MKKVLFYLPAVIYTIAVIALNIILKTFSPLWYAWVVLLWLGGFLLKNGKVWGCLFGLLPAIHLLYMNTQSTGQVYVPTDFDTIEKAFSGVKTAEKGIKQGLSRSITDSESPFSLYSVVDFCRSKVRRHRGV